MDLDALFGSTPKKTLEEVIELIETEEEAKEEKREIPTTPALTPSATSPIADKLELINSYLAKGNLPDLKEALMHVFIYLQNNPQIESMIEDSDVAIISRASRQFSSTVANAKPAQKKGLTNKGMNAISGLDIPKKKLGFSDKVKDA